MKQGVFITGTDTDVGKTTYACALIRSLSQAGLRVAGLKPIAAGCESTPDGWRHADALALQTASSVALPYKMINPITLIEPIAPHLAAETEGVHLDVEGVLQACQPMRQQSLDHLIVEGAGGWLVPLNGQQTMADLAVALDFPVILVVAMRLGCLNHALLSAKAIRATGLPLLGWVANCLDPDMARQADNIATLSALLPAPLLAKLPAGLPADARVSTELIRRYQIDCATI